MDFDAEVTPNDTRAAMQRAIERIERKVDKSLHYSMLSYELAKRGSRPGLWFGVASLVVSCAALAAALIW